MKEHIFILGPPASGKLSVALDISKSTGFQVFDNAKTVDIATLLYSFGTENYRRYRDTLRFQFYNELLTSDKKGIISTYCYSGPENIDYLYSVDRLLRRNEISTYFVYLIASESVLFKRVTNESRKAKNTFHDIETLKCWLKNNPMWNEINISEALTVNTDGVDAHAVSELILKHIRSRRNMSTTARERE